MKEKDNSAGPVMKIFPVSSLENLESIESERGRDLLTLGQVATVDHHTSPIGIPRGNPSKSDLVYLVYNGRLSIRTTFYWKTIVIVTLRDKCGNQRQRKVRC